MYGFVFVVVSTDLDWIRRGPNYRSDEHCKEILGHVKGGVFIEWLRIH
jgi:hypothetical protein